MNSITQRSGTSAVGNMRSGPWHTALVLAVGVGLGTSASPASAPSWSTPASIQLTRLSTRETRGGEHESVPTSVAAVAVRADQARYVMELRRVSGLTWDQMARLFDVSRRTLHFWASGNPMLPTHEERLVRVLATVRRMDQGSAVATRRVLMSITTSNELPFDLLAAGRYSELALHVGAGKLTKRPTLTPLSEQAREARRPISPSIAADALHGSAHRDSEDQA